MGCPFNEGFEGSSLGFQGLPLAFQGLPLAFEGLPVTVHAPDQSLQAGHGFGVAALVFMFLAFSGLGALVIGPHHAGDSEPDNRERGGVDYQA